MRIFHILGHPDPILNCTQYNHSSDSVSLKCIPGYDGGMGQIFTLELFEDNPRGHKIMVRNSTQTSSDFAIKGLSPGSVFRARIYASNPKGQSEGFVVNVSTLKRPSEKRLATTASGGECYV